ncbi:trafficking protein particle complex subunit 12 [Ixodes scapularis]|uniref:trafficking protein particle complex subunit 12 n=1 Tax=Ixodes scapularis TaxID=6945 RepID=UPI001A9D7394|nr:trafficking protein particle complex subunit 12 [Ixodes scapularis]
MSEPVESCTSSGPGADPDSSQSSVRCGDDDDTANMETVALDTTDIYQELVQADEAGHDMSISLDSDPGKEADLKRYFAHTPTDAAPCSFFDSLSVSTSPMMKSVSEASMVQAASSVQDAIPEALAQSRPLEESGLFFSVGETPGEEATAVIAQEALEGTVEFHSAPVLEEVESIQASSEPPADTRAASSADEGPSLSKFFSSDCSGGDQEGKAFFDVLAAEIAGGDKSRRSSGSASPLSMVQESCLIADAPPTDDGDLCAYDNWLPSAATREFLARLATSEPGTVFPDREHLTMPGIIVEEPQGDPVRALLQEHIAEEMVHRRTLTADDVPQNEEGLRQLLGAQCHNAAINLTTRLLTSVGQGPGAGGHPSRHSPHSLQLWYTRLALFVKLRKFALAEVEAEAFGDLDRPDLYYEFYPDSYPGKRGSMVPFAFRLLLAELPQFQGNHSTALNALYKLLNIVHHILANLTNGVTEGGSLLDMSEHVRQASMKLWEDRECRVYFAILNCVLSQKDFVVAIKVARILLEKNSGRKAQLYSAIGRIYLQLGDVDMAQSHFHKAELLYYNMGLEGRLEVLINKGMMALAQNSYSDAYHFYEEASKLQPKNPLFVNNMAVCLLYLGRLGDSVSLLEATVRTDPSLCLHEGFLFNVCTLYELQSSEAGTRKRAMLRLVGRHAGDGFNAASLKMQPAKT